MSDHPLKTLCAGVPLAGLFFYTSTRSFPVLFATCLISTGYLSSILLLSRAKTEDVDSMGKSMKNAWGMSFLSSLGLAGLGSAGLVKKTVSTGAIRALPGVAVASGLLAMYYSGKNYQEWRELEGKEEV